MVWAERHPILHGLTSAACAIPCCAIQETASISFPISLGMAYLVRWRTRRKGNGKIGSLRQAGESGNCCPQRGLAENRMPGAAGGLGFCSQRRGQAGGEGAITGIFFLLNTCSGRGKTAKAEHRTTLPKGQNWGSFWLTLQMVLLLHQRSRQLGTPH